jgi:hypothetical protein
MGLRYIIYHNVRHKKNIKYTVSETCCKIIKCKTKLHPSNSALSPRTPTNSIDQSHWTAGNRSVNEEINSFTEFQSFTLPWTTWINVVPSHSILSHVRMFLATGLFLWILLCNWCMHFPLPHARCMSHPFNELALYAYVSSRSHTFSALLMLFRRIRPLWGPDDVSDKLETNAAATPRNFPITLRERGDLSFEMSR